MRPDDLKNKTPAELYRWKMYEKPNFDEYYKTAVYNS